MITTVERPQKRISVRVDDDLYTDVERVADERFEGKFAMAARAAFRLLVNERPVDAPRTESEQSAEVALAS